MAASLLLVSARRDGILSLDRLLRGLNSEPPALTSEHVSERLMTPLKLIYYNRVFIINNQLTRTTTRQNAPLEHI